MLFLNLVERSLEYGDGGLSLSTPGQATDPLLGGAVGTARHCCRDGMELAPREPLLPSEAVSGT